MAFAVSWAIISFYTDKVIKDVLVPKKSRSLNNVASSLINYLFINKNFSTQSSLKHFILAYTLAMLQLH